MLGVPFAIKDDTDIAGEVTARGTNAYGDPATADAEVVRRLRAAGAVIVGKTHVPELMITPFTESPTFGATRNPWDLNRTPGGSSGGSAAAVAAGLVGGALAPTAAARSASPPAAAACSASSPSATGSRWRRRESTGTACRSTAPSPATSPTPPSSST